jgi:hypothetical protein
MTHKHCLDRADVEHHALLGIPRELLAAVARRVTDKEAREVLGGVKHTGDLAGIAYARLDPETGATRGYRVRRDHPEIENGTPRDKYLSSRDQPVLFFAPGAGVLLTDTGVTVVIVEAEKSSLALTAASARTGRPLLAIATGGDWGWKGRIGKTTAADGARVDEKGVLPDFDRIAWLDRDVVLVFDANAATNPKVYAARGALATHLTNRGARVRIADLPVEAGVNGPDDFVAKHGDVPLLVLIDEARPLQPRTAAEALHLAKLDDLHGVELSEIERRLRLLRDVLRGADVIRRAMVREMLVVALKAIKVSRVAALADAATHGPDEAGDPAHDLVADDVPWPDRVEGAALLDALVEAVRRHVVLSREAARAIVLWIVLSYCDSVVDLLPLLLVTGPTKRCGKTRTVEIVGALASRALSVSNITAAALYRVIDKYHPTLLLDEADTFINDDPELRGVVNGGHTRHTARVIRCVGDDSDPTVFSTWCPKLVSMIGTPKDTIIDRSIVIRLERMARGESVERLRPEHAHLVFSDRRRQIRRWVDDHLDAIRAADPAMPTGLHDRAIDNWRPLLAIADLAGGAWPTHARHAVCGLAGHGNDDEPIAEQLLADLYTIFHDEATVFDSRKRDRLSTARVTELLVALDSKPWATYNTKTAKPLTQHQVARLLKRFNVRPIKTKIDMKTTNCYLRADLEPVWNRYNSSSQVGTPEPAND